jgi:hypothetical protein
MRNLQVLEFKFLNMQARDFYAGGAETGIGRARSAQDAVFGVLRKVGKKI